MYHEIERKFLVQNMPNIKGVVPTLQERYFLQRGDLVEERIQKNGTIFEYEKKVALSPREWRRNKKQLTEEEFKELSRKASKVLKRESYSLSKKNPRVSIKVYLGEYKGFIFAEVEFDSLKECETFTPLTWMGSEITNSPLGRDAWLLDYDREHFLKKLKTEKSKLDTEDVANGL